jgi:sugar phosphate isomerase/epimerase
VEGQLPWYIVAENTSDDVVLQLDTGNALAGGADVLETLKAFPGRNQSVHWKPYSKSAGFAVPVGADDQDWAAQLEWSKKEGRTEWIVLEYEEEEPLEMLRRSMEFIRGL